MNAMILKPHVSEKSIGLAATGTYIFEVPMATNKIEISKAVEAAFNVKVDRVTTLIGKGKVVHSRTRGKRVPGRRPDRKKAMVTLKPGNKITLFEEGDK